MQYKVVVNQNTKPDVVKTLMIEEKKDIPQNGFLEEEVKNKQQTVLSVVRTNLTIHLY